MPTPHITVQSDPPEVFWQEVNALVDFANSLELQIIELRAQLAALAAIVATKKSA